MALPSSRFRVSACPFLRKQRAMLASRVFPGQPCACAGNDTMGRGDGMRRDRALALDPTHCIFKVHEARSADPIIFCTMQVIVARCVALGLDRFHFGASVHESYPAGCAMIMIPLWVFQAPLGPVKLYPE